MVVIAASKALVIVAKRIANVLSHNHFSFISYAHKLEWNLHNIICFTSYINVSSI